MADTSRRTMFPPSDDPLRRDVGLVGALLGDVLRLQGGDALFDNVEAARLAAIRRRGGDPVAGDELADLLAGLSPGDARELVRAFSAYFSLVNMAEQAHSLRRRRDFLHEPSAPQPGTLADVGGRLAEMGLDRARVESILTGMQIVPVFTAHPTEARRRTILAKQQRVLTELVDRSRSQSLTPFEQEEQVRRLRREISLLWQTAEHPSVSRTVADEVEHVLFYLRDVIYPTVPWFYLALGRALDDAFGPGDGTPIPCPLIRFGSWVGGDMDGNPNVGPETIETTLGRQRHLILDHYRHEVQEVFSHLSQSLSRVEVEAGILDQIQLYRDRMPEAWLSIPARYHDMPYRTLLWLIWERLGRTQADLPGAYGGPEDLLDDLRSIISSLAAHRGRDAGMDLVGELCQRVETFGFHFATLDIRQDALLHRRVVGRLLADPGFCERPPAERTDLLERAVRGECPLESPSDDESRRALSVLETIAGARRRHGPAAVGPYIISMAQGPDDALALLLLARQAGHIDSDDHVPLDIAPLFETVDDLEAAADTLRSLLDNPIYRSHLGGRENRQLLMLGYSDSSKISGLAASRWALYQTQERLIEIAEQAGVGLTLFHGRGGTVARGGSKPRDAILADPCGAVRGRLRLTEQGEIVHAKYGHPGIAELTFELMAGAVLEATALCDRSTPLPEVWTEAMDSVARAGRRAYDDLVHHNPDLVPYFRLATPIDVIERLGIGSRPPSRRTGGGVENLRAIPWVFAWMQSRHMLPGWFGIGAGLESAFERHGEAVLHDMARGWPFFANLLGDVEMVMAKTDMEIAGRYAELAGEVGARLFPTIRSAFDQTKALVTRIQGVERLLDNEPELQRALLLRNPYVDPMSMVQIDLLRRWRAGGREDQDLEAALFTSVRGVARGLQNTG